MVWIPMLLRKATNRSDSPLSDPAKPMAIEVAVEPFIGMAVIVPTMDWSTWTWRTSTFA